MWGNLDMSCGKNKGFSTIEVLVAVSIVIILATIVLGVGKRLKTQADERLARSAIEVIVTALSQYYDYHGGFPVAEPFDPGPPEGYDRDDFRSVLVNDLGNGTITGNHNYNDEDWSSEALYYFLSRVPSSRKIIAAISERLMTNEDDYGIQQRFTYSRHGEDVDLILIRFIDPWSNALRYSYLTGDNFPLIVSAGADGDFDTQADNISSRDM